MRFDTPLSEHEKKKIIILFRACTTYSRSTVESTIRFLYPRVEETEIEGRMDNELRSARFWWSELEECQRARMNLQYRTTITVH